MLYFYIFILVLTVRIPSCCSWSFLKFLFPFQFVLDKDWTILHHNFADNVGAMQPNLGTDLIIQS